MLMVILDLLQVLSSTGTALNWVDADSGTQGVQGIAGSTEMDLRE